MSMTNAERQARFCAKRDALARQAADVPALQARIKELEDRIRELEARLAAKTQGARNADAAADYTTRPQYREIGAGKLRHP